MTIDGFQPMTLLDWPGKVGCTVFLAGCNFRCPFCHNGPLVEGKGERPTPALALETFRDFLRRRQGLLDGVCVSGGEPLLNPQLPQLLEAVKEQGFLVKVDTNGSFPHKLRELWKSGLVDYVAMDIKNSPDRYAETAGVAELDLTPIRESVAWLLEGHVDYEFRTTVVRQFHDAASFAAIGPWIAGARRYFLQTFTQRDTVLRGGLSAWDGETMEHFAAQMRPYVAHVEVR
ncbi:MAG TPA: anaerobic ribonucleoside-triphosphate reductase activating protein [Candidatus Enterenecus avicola]|nr:anaerobic ribonucleoside-triphosphate reductase activating protein [Candidatus Enterenecus avicola]